MNLIDFLKKSKFSRKIFGERELRIIEKQLNGISLTQSEKNRLSRDIRPKFEFIKECSNLKNEFELKKGSLNKNLIDDAVGVILEDKLSRDIKKIFLFGSIIENKLTFSSDIDIAILFSEISIREATLFRARISGRVSNKIDTQVFNVLPDKVKSEIMKKSKVLYENK